MRPFAPLLRVNARQARTIRRLTRLVERQSGRIVLLERERDAARADAELVLALVPDDKKRVACALVRDRHRVADLPETKEAG